MDLESVRPRSLLSQPTQLNHFCSFEVNLGIVAACIPTLRPGYLWTRSRLFSSKKTSSIHLPLAIVPKDSFNEGSRTTIRHGSPGRKGSRVGVPDDSILQTTTVDVEHGIKENI